MVKIIGICGFSGSGKSYYSNKLKRNYKNSVILSTDRYYKTVPPNVADYNFDDPEAIDFCLLIYHLHRLKNGASVNLPNYNFNTHSRESFTTTINPITTIILEGIFILCIEKLRELIDELIFIDTSEEISLSRRIDRDIKERGREKLEIIRYHSKFVKPSQDKYIKPFIKYCNIKINNDRFIENNEVNEENNLYLY